MNIDKKRCTSYHRKNMNGKEVCMHKTEMVRRIAGQTRLAQTVVRDVVNAQHRLIAETLRSGENAVFPGFGTFYTGKRRGGKVRHVKTGAVVSYPPRTVAAFKVGDVLKRAVAGKR